MNRTAALMCLALVVVVLGGVLPERGAWRGSVATAQEETGGPGRPSGETSLPRAIPPRLDARLIPGLAAAPAHGTLPPLPTTVSGAQALAHEGRYIVRFKQPPVHAAASMVRSMGGQIHHAYTIIPAMAVRMSRLAAEALANDPSVAYVEPDIPVGIPRPVYTDASVQPAQQTVPWGITRVGAPAVHAAGNTGAGVKVAVIDTGIDYTHPDLAANYKGGRNFIAGNNNPMDDEGHGTHCAGTVGARDNSIGVIGVAPQAWLYALKVLDAQGRGTASNVIAALDWCATNGMQVASISIQSTGFSRSYQEACDSAVGRGVLVVAANGNDPPTPVNQVAYPAAYASVIGVAAVNESGSRPSSSCYGPETELAAPGVGVNSTVPGGGYRSSSGTSMACPHVAGVAALVIAQGGNTSPSAVRARLVSTAEDLGTAGRDQYYGYGLARADQAAGPPTQPHPTVTAVTPSAGLNTGTVSIAVTGADFRAGAAVKLTRSGHADIAGSAVTLVSSTRITCVLNLAGAALGAWNVVVLNSDGKSGVLPNGFHVSAPPGTYDEDFETGSLSKWPWRTGGHANWAVTTTDRRSGSYSARAGSISHNQATYIEVTRDCQAGTISFFKRVSSEASYDWLVFSIDGVQQDRWSGDGAWNTTAHSYSVAAGTRIFRWEYTKDVSVSSHQDTAWIDDITFPPAAAPAALAVTGIDPASGVNTGIVNVAITGTGFAPGAGAKLARSGHSDINGTGLSVVSATRITCAVNLAGAVIGTWNVVVTNPDGRSDELVHAFTVNPAVATYSEDFETGNLSKWPWSTGGDANWTVTTSDRRSGSYSAQAGTIGHNQAGYLEVRLACQAGNISFFKRVSSEANYDWLIFYIDGVEQGRWSGDGAWNTAAHSYPVEAGTHTFRWEYTKDVTLSSHADTAWIDDITFPPGAAPATLAVTGIDPASGVNDRAVSVAITGAGFSAGATAKLTRSGHTDINGAGVSVVSSARLTCSLNLSGAAVGAWNVVVTNPGGASGQLPGGFTVSGHPGAYDEDFEPENRDRWPWLTGGSEYWVITTTDKRSGSYSAQAGGIGHGQYTYIEVTLDCRAGNISFFKRVSSEANYDWLIFSVDGAVRDRWSGDGAWNTTAHSYPVAAGKRTFRWEYTKDDTVSRHSDTAWIDDITFPPLEASPTTTTFPAGLQMVSLPVVPTDPDPAQLGFETGRWARWDPAISNYRTHPHSYTRFEPADSVPGKGYWARFAQATAVNVAGSPPPAAAYTVQVPAGWAQIGNPRATGVPWSITGAGALMVRRGGITRTLAQAQAAGWCEDFAWAYRAAVGYELVYDPAVAVVGARSSLAPWQGYWFRAHRAVELIFPAVTTAAAAAARPPAERAEGEWSIPLLAALEDGSAAQAVVGQATRARRMDLPPGFGGGVELSVLAGGARLGVDLREVGEAPVWTLEAVTTAPDAKVTLRWPDLGAVPPDCRPVLVDLATGKRTYMRTSPGYTYTADAAGTRRFEVRLAPSGADALALTGVAAATAGGGSVELRVTLSSAATLDAEVLNIAGRQVGTVCRGRELDAGAAVVLWNAQSDLGTRVPGGRYLIRVTARTEDGQQSSVIAPLQLGR